MQYLGLTAFNERGNGFVNVRPVSYTHLDVYKRQTCNSAVEFLYLVTENLTYLMTKNKK